MKFQSKAALSLLLCAVLAIPTAALAGKGGPKEDPTRDPSTKDCDNIVLETRCSGPLDAPGLLDQAYSLVKQLSDIDQALIANGEDPVVFVSRNGQQDAATLMCKISGAEIKLAQDYKDDEASFLLETAIAKVMSLEGQGKMFDAGIKDALAAAKYCVDNP